MLLLSGWSTWLPGACPVSCGNGTATHTRYCEDNNGSEVNSTNCEGDETEMEVPCSSGIDCPGYGRLKADCVFDVHVSSPGQVQGFFNCPRLSRVVDLDRGCMLCDLRQWDSLEDKAMCSGQWRWQRQ